MGVSTPCTFCRQPSLFKPADGVHVCENCAARIGEFARDTVVVQTIWDLTTPPTETKPSAPRQEVDLEEVLRSLQEGVSKSVPIDAALAHADLAAAYAEMGLNADALREAGVALGRTPDALATQTALRVLLRSTMMKPSGLRALKRRLRR